MQSANALISWPSQSQITRRADPQPDLHTVASAKPTAEKRPNPTANQSTEKKVKKPPKHSDSIRARLDQGKNSISNSSLHNKRCLQPLERCIQTHTHTHPRLNASSLLEVLSRFFRFFSVVMLGEAANISLSKGLWTCPNAVLRTITLSFEDWYLTLRTLSTFHTLHFTLHKTSSVQPCRQAGLNATLPVCVFGLLLFFFFWFVLFGSCSCLRRSRRVVV